MFAAGIAGQLVTRGGWRAVTADDFPRGASHLAGAVGVGLESPAELVEHHVVVPPAISVLQVREAGAAAVREMLDVVRLAAGGRLVTAA